MRNALVALGVVAIAVAIAVVIVVSGDDGDKSKGGGSGTAASQALTPGVDANPPAPGDPLSQKLDDLADVPKSEEEPPPPPPPNPPDPTDVPRPTSDKSVPKAKGADARKIICQDAPVGVPRC